MLDSISQRLVFFCKLFIIKTYQFVKRRKKYLVGAAVIFVFYALYSPIVDELILKRVSPLLEVKSDGINDIFFGAIFLLSILLFFGKYLLAGRVKDVWHSFFLPAVVLIVYMLPRTGLVKTSHAGLTHFRSVHWLTYLDGVVLLLLQFLTRFSKDAPTRITRPEIPTLIEDDIYRSGAGDLFRRTSYAGWIAQMIVNTGTRTSFAIAVKGGWGSGKSVFLNQIQQGILTCVTFRFNPWLSLKAANIVMDFFHLLTKTISDYDRTLARKFERYSEILLNVDENFAKKVLSSLKILRRENKDESLEYWVKEIKNVLRRERLKLVVFVDDLDRLSGEEILAVLKLIRNSFNFPNVFFVVAYDEAYIKDALDRVKISDDFMQKIFQMEVYLPSFPLSILESQLQNLILAGKTDSQITLLKGAFAYLQDKNIFSKTLLTMRDIIRFANSVNHVYQRKFEEIDHVDFLLIEVLKLKRKGDFQMVRDYLTINLISLYFTKGKLGGKETGPIKFVPAQAGDDKVDMVSTKIFTELFNREQYFDEIKSVRFPVNAFRYFSDDLFDSESYKNLEAYKSPTFEALKRQLESLGDQALADFEALLVRVNQYATAAEFYNINKAILYCENKLNQSTYTRIVTQHIKEYFPEPPDQAGIQILKRMLTGTEWDAVAESFVIGEFLDVYMYEGTQAAGILTKQQGTEWLLGNLADFIGRHGRDFSVKVFDIYYKVIDKIDNSRVIINRQANEYLGAYCQANADSYFGRWLIRPKFLGNINSPTSVLEPFIPQYLTYEKFEELLYAMAPNVDRTKIQGFYVKFKHENFEEAEYDANVVEVFSDRRTLFTGSVDYRGLPRNAAVEVPGKSEYPEKLDLLKYSKWISQSRTITMQEAVQGGRYNFERDFFLDNVANLKSAKLVYLVDDYLRISINGGDFVEVPGGFANLNVIDIKSHLRSGPNKIIFEVKNVSMDEGKLEGNPSNNPFELVYYLRIAFEGEKGG
jgi:hypothetical protein